MVDYPQIAMFTILVPIVMGILSHLIAKLPKIGALLAKAVCIVTSYVVFLSVLSLAPAIASNPIKDEIVRFPLITNTASVGLYVDYLALIPALLCSLFGALALTFAVHYLSPKNKAYNVGLEFNRGYSFSLLLVGAIIGALFSSDLLGLLVFWELISVCLYGLVLFWYEDKISVQAAFKCFVMTHVGSLALFIAAVVLSSETGTFRIFELGNDAFLSNSAVLIALPFLLVAILPKAVQLPFYTWLPDATVAPTSTMILFLIGDLTGIYLLIRFFLQVFQPILMRMPIVPFTPLFGNINIWSLTISMIGAITLIIAALNAVIENDLKRIVAYSVVSELGYIVMATGLATPLGMAAGLFYLTSHVFVAGLLFLCAGAVVYATGKHNINEIGGLYRYMPITTTCCALSVLAIGGMPLLSEFAGKYLIIHSTLDVGSPFFLLVTVLGGVLHIAIAIRLLYSVFLTRTEISLDSTVSDPPISMLAPMLVMATAIIVLGVMPTILLDLLIIPGIQQLGFVAKIVEPLGIVTPSLGFWSSIIVTVSMLALLSVFVFAVTYLTKKATYRQKTSEDTFKPFLCGEDATTFYSPPSDHFYYALAEVLKIDQICHRLNIDRFYYSLSEKFSQACAVLLKLDIHQRFMPAFLSFIVGTILILIAILVV